MRNDLPIIVGHQVRTGIVLFRKDKMGGCDMFIVGLNKELETGTKFDPEDVEWIKAVLHFTDVSSLRTTVKVMSKTLEDWEKEGDKDGTN